MPPTVRNVLVIMTDQHRHDAAGCTGNPHIHTPTLDRLAATGAVFDRAYTPSPVCVPARQSLLTGRLPHQHGATGNARAMHPGERTIAHLARDAGFATGAIGKMHFIGPDQHQGFDARWDIAQYHALEPEASGDAASGMAAPGCYGRYVPGLEEGSSAAGPNPMRTYHGNYDAQPSPFPAERHVEAHTTRRAIQFLEEHRAERWMLWCSYWKPHAPYTPPLEDWERYAHMPLPLPHVDPASVVDLPKHLRRFRENTGVGELDAAALRRCIAGYYGSVTFVDRLVGELLASLDALGLREDTLVVFTSDHGEMLGDHGLLAKSNFYEEAWRVPLVVSHPAFAPTRSPTLASLVDLFPTIADAAGLPVPAAVAGRSLLPVISRQVDAVREHVFGELAYPGGPFYGVTDGEWKFATYAEETQLFHLPDDPHENRNLASSAPDQVARLSALAAAQAALH